MENEWKMNKRKGKWIKNEWRIGKWMENEWIMNKLKGKWMKNE